MNLSQLSRYDKVLLCVLTVLTLIFVAALLWTIIRLPHLLVVSTAERMEISQRRLNEISGQINFGRNALQDLWTRINQLDTDIDQLNQRAVDAQDQSRVNQIELDNIAKNIDRLTSQTGRLSDQVAIHQDWITAHVRADKAISELHSPARSRHHH
jgi:septal ring factor EnvC (AmiA/AmiB activator)